MIKNIVFDIGRVLVHFDWRASAAEMFHDEKVVDAVMDACFGHGIWNELDRGVWTTQQLLDGFCSYHPEVKEQIYAFFERVPFILTPYDFARSWISDLQERGYRVYYLSNWSDHINSNNPQLLQFLRDTADGGIFSWEEKLIKPDPAIYRLLLERYGLQAEECVFIDDTEPNAEAAREVGMAAIHCRNHEQTVSELEKLLTEEPSSESVN